MSIYELFDNYPNIESRIKYAKETYGQPLYIKQSTYNVIVKSECMSIEFLSFTSWEVFGKYQIIENINNRILSLNNNLEIIKILFLMKIYVKRWYNICARPPKTHSHNDGGGNIYKLYKKTVSFTYLKILIYNYYSMNISHYITTLESNFQQQLDQKDAEIEILKNEIHKLKPNTTVNIPRKISTTQKDIIDQLKTITA